MEDNLSKLTGFRVKVVENGGNKLSQVLPIKTTSDMSCGRMDCWTCSQGDEKPVNCFRRSVLYESECSLCKKRKEEGMELNEEHATVYVGETSRSLYERTKEHIADAGKRMENSHIRKHWDEAHPGENMPTFKFKMVGSFKDCLTRQVAEAVRIMNKGRVLNSKSEFSRCHISRLTVEKTEWEEKAEEKKKWLEKMEKNKRDSSPEEDIGEDQEILDEQRAGKKNERKDDQEHGERKKKKARLITDWLKRTPSPQEDKEQLSSLEEEPQTEKAEEVGQGEEWTNTKEQDIIEEEETWWTSWEEKYSSHLEEVKKEQRESEENRLAKIEKAALMEKRWEMLRWCHKEMKDNSMKWWKHSEAQNEIKEEGERLEERHCRLERAAKKKEKYQIGENKTSLGETQCQRMERAAIKRSLWIFQP